MRNVHSRELTDLLMIGWPLPLVALQILWLNLITDIFPAFALALEPSAPDVMKRPPRDPKESLLTPRFIGLIVWQGLLLAGVTLVAFGVGMHWHGTAREGLRQATTMAFMTLALSHVFHAFNSRSQTHSAFTIRLFTNGWLWAAVGMCLILQAAAVYVPILQKVLHTVPPTISDWGVIAACSLVPVAVVEFFHVNNAVANLAPIPDGLSDEQAAYCSDMLSTGFVAAEFANIPIGGSVAIFSQGPVGMMATVGARLRGAGLVIGVESMPNRIALAKQYGCDVVVDFTKEGPVEAILKLTGGKGVDSAIEALGTAETFAACVSVTRPGGTISNVGYHGDGDSVPIPREAWGVGMSDKTIRTALCPGGSERMSRLLRLIETGRVDPLALTTHRFPFQDIEKAFQMMQTKEDGMIKPLITFG